MCTIRNQSIKWLCKIIPFEVLCIICVGVLQNLIFSHKTNFTKNSQNAVAYVPVHVHMYIHDVHIRVYCST